MNSESAPQMIRPERVIVGVDGSDSSIQALREAARLARALDADLVAIATWRDPAAYGYIAPDWSPQVQAREKLQNSIDTAFGDDVPDRLQVSVLEGPPARTLIKASAGAAMLVVGSRGHGGFAGMLLGSVSAACAEYAHCPVLVYHQPRADTEYIDAEQ